MFSHWPIQNKLKLGLGLLAISVAALFMTGIYGLYAYRELAKSLSARSAELPLAKELSNRVSDMRITLSQARERLDVLPESVTIDSDNDEPNAIQDVQLTILKAKYQNQFEWFRQTLESYRQQLEASRQSGTGLGDDGREQTTLVQIDELLASIKGPQNSETSSDYALDSASDNAFAQLPEFAFTNALLFEGARPLDELRLKLDKLHKLSVELPSHLHKRLAELVGEVRSQYRVAIRVVWATALVATSLLIASLLLFRKWIAHPLRILVEGSRKVSREQNFGHRIHLETNDEMQELAGAMNEMTARFQEIRDDLDQQVRDQTKQVVRSEQLASVGFLAAGIAHEINNPLASITLGSESLVSRLAELTDEADAPLSAERQVFKQYLELIHREAFRCKEITEKLLDFSRRGEAEKHNADLRELVLGVIEMARLGKYQDKQIVLREGEPVIAQVNAQELKQVVLNLITNALDSIDTGGTVTLSVLHRGNDVEIVVEDDGCGMSDEVIQHLFEPFFTRRRNGQGTGLGLSISFRIIEEHNGEIVASRRGKVQGSKFTVKLPVRQPIANDNRELQAA